MLLLIDNYDSFTYNLAQAFGALGVPLKIVRNDHIHVEDLSLLNPDYLVLSPGPGRPEQAGVTIELIRMWGTRVPTLGICLGHQAIGAAYGAKVVNASVIKHGKTSEIRHNGDPLFSGVPCLFKATRYHSLILQRDSLPPSFSVIAETEEGEVMGIRYKHYPLIGLQFHPESIYTPCGNQILANFIKIYSRKNIFKGGKSRVS